MKDKGKEGANFPTLPSQANLLPRPCRTRHQARCSGLCCLHLPTHRGRNGHRGDEAHQHGPVAKEQRKRSTRPGQRTARPGAKPARTFPSGTTFCPWDGALCGSRHRNKCRHGPREQAKPMGSLSRWLGVVPAAVKPWQALIADGADPNAYLHQDSLPSAISRSSPRPLVQGGRTWPNAAARGQLARQLASSGLPPSRYSDCAGVDGELTGRPAGALTSSNSSAELVAKINQRDHKGQTALDLAIARGHKEVETLLTAYIEARQRPRGCPILQMPGEVLVLILSWLEPRDLCATAQACTVPKPLCTRMARQLFCDPQGLRVRRCLHNSAERRPCGGDSVTHNSSSQPTRVGGTAIVSGSLPAFTPTQVSKRTRPRCNSQSLGRNASVPPLAYRRQGKLHQTRADHQVGSDGRTQYYSTPPSNMRRIPRTCLTSGPARIQG